MPVESPPRNTRGAVRLAWGVSALAAVAAWAVGCGEPQPPVATGRIPALTVEVGNTESVDLAAHFSDADGDILTYTAVSSDPGVATAAVSGATVQVTAVAAGNATVTVTASDPGGLSADQTFAVTVPNRTPVAVGRIPDAEIFVGEAVEIALASYFDDPDGDALTYAAASSSPGVATAAVTDATLRVAGATQGVATVTVTASDAGGLSATQTFSVTVPNRAPEAVGSIDDAETFVGESFTVALPGYFSDPDGDDLTYAANLSNSSVATVSVSGDTLRVAGVSQGTVVVTVTASDASGLSASQTLLVTVPNRAPEAVGSIDDAETFVGESFTVALPGYFSDPDGDDLTYAANLSNSSVATVSVSGDTLRVAGVSQGTVVVTVTASDAGGLSASQTLLVTVPNRAPEAVGSIDDAETFVGESFTVALPGYFSDPDGDDLTYAANLSNSSVATVSVSGDTLRVAGVSQGTVVVTVTASDAGGLSATQTFSVTVPNRAPEAVGSIDDAETFVGESFTVALPGYFSDPDGDDLTYAANLSNSSVATVSVSGDTLRVAGVSQGTVVVTVTASDAGGLSATQAFAVTVPNRAPEAVGSIDDAETFVGESFTVALPGHFSDPDGDALAYAANSSNSGVAGASVSGGTLRVAGVGQGVATVTVTASDAGGLSATQAFAVTVPNRAPEAVGSIDDAETFVGESFTVALPGYFSDPDGDALAYAANSSNSGVAGASVSGGTLRVAGVGQGVATVTVTASDAGGLSATQAFAVTVPNRAPEAVGSIDDAETFVGESFTVALPGHFSDPDGDALAYAANSSNSGVAGASVSGGTLRVAGVGQGVATVTVTASDAGGLSATQAFAVTVPNRAPEAVGSIDDAETFVGESFTVALPGHFSDPDGDALAYAANSSNSGVAGASVSGGTLRVAGVGQGVATVTVTASDAGGLSATQAFSVTVPNRAPEAVGSIDDAETFVGESFTVALPGYFSDPDGDALAYAANSSNSGVAGASVSGGTLRVAGVGQGVATVTVTASDAGGLSATQAFSVTVPNRAPEAVGSIDDAETFVGESFTVALPGYFSDPDGDALAYAAKSSNSGVAGASVSGGTLRVAGVGQGVATVTVTASDVGGLSATQAFSVTVPNRVPEAVGSIDDAETFVGESFTVALPGYFSDPDGDALAYAANSSNSGVAGASVSGGTLRVAGVGQGVATVTVTASDAGGLSATQTFSVTVPNRAPEAVGSIDDAETFVGESFTVALPGYFSDPDGDDLTYAANLSNSSVATVSVSGGTLRVAGVGQGVATVTVTASDAGGLSATQAFSVTVPNRAPEAVGSIDDAETFVGESFTVALPGHFSDPDGDALAYAANSSNSGVAGASVSGGTLRVAGVGQGVATVTVTASDAGGLSATQAFSVTVPNRAPEAVGSIDDAETFVGESFKVALPGHFSDPDGDALAYAANSSNSGVAGASVSGGTLRVAGVGQGVATVTVTASDAGGLSATQTFAVTVPNRAPEAVGSIDDAETFVGESFKVALPGYFSDPDGDALAYAANSSNSGVAGASVSGGTLRVAGVGQGVATVTVTASDAGGLSATQTFAVTVPNRAPEAVGSIDDAETFVGESFKVALPGYFSDPDGDALAYAANSSNSGVAGASVSGGTLRVAGVGQGVATVTVTASDAGGLSASQTFSVTVPNRAPETVGSIDDAETFVGESFTVALPGYFSDPDGDALAYAATSSNTGVATVNVSGDTLRVAGVSGGAATVTATASDPDGLSASHTFTATVPNRAPEAVGHIDDAGLAVGDTVEISLSQHFSDPDGDDLSYSASSSDDDVATASVSGATLRVAGVGKGTATITATATDPGDLSATQTFAAAVEGNRPPVAVGSIDDAGPAAGDTVEIALSGYFSDPDGDELSYAATSSNTGVATVNVSGDTLRVAGVSGGAATVTATASDPDGLSASHTFTATVPNRAPEAVGHIDDAGLAVGDTVEVSLSQHFSDPDGDDLSYSASSSDDNVATASVSGATLRVAGVGKGTATITATATDPGDLSATQTFAAAVGSNRPPVAVGSIDDAGPAAGDTVEIALSGYFSDPDGDELSYAATSSNTGVATVNVSGDTLRVAGVSGGAATVTATASDPDGLSASQTFTATVPNRAPEAVGQIDDAETFVGESIEIALSGYFSDPDGDELTYWATASDGNVATVYVSGDTLRVSGVGNGTATITATTSDPDSLSANQTFAAAILTRSTAYLVQAVQSRSDSVPVVAEKQALLRVFVTATRATTETLPPAKATFYVDGSETYSVEIDGTSGAIPTEIDEGSLAKSLNVTIPASEIEEGLSVVIDIDPDSTIDAEILVAKRIPNSGELDLGVEDVPGFELTVIPFLYTDDPDSSVLDYVDSMESEEEDHELLHDTYDLLPIEEMSVDDHDPVEIDTENLFDVLYRTRAIRAAESGSGYWMGLMEKERKGVIGVAFRPGTSSASVPDASTIAHELGHNLSLWHAPCGRPAGVDPGYPHDDGSIGAWGYDHRDGSLVDSATYDLMTYCDPAWISDYHFEKAVRYRTAQARSDGEESGRRGPSLLVWGSRSASGELSMDPALVVEGRSLLPQAPGDYTLTGLDDARRELFSISFDMAEPADAEEGTGMFVFLLPVEPGWEALASIVLAGPGGTVFTLDGDTEATMAWIRDARSGQVRAIRGDLDERPSVPPGHVVRWSRGIPDRDAWRPR